MDTKNMLRRMMTMNEKERIKEKLYDEFLKNYNLCSEQMYNEKAICDRAMLMSLKDMTSSMDYENAGSFFYNYREKLLFEIMQELEKDNYLLSKDEMFKNVSKILTQLAEAMDYLGDDNGN